MFYNCNNNLQKEIATDQVVGKFPQFINYPQLADTQQEFFQIIDIKSKKKYLAQRWEDKLVFMNDHSRSLPMDDLQIFPLENAPPNQVLVKEHKENGTLSVSIQQQPVLSYQLSEKLPDNLPAHYKRSGFIHPLYSPTGQILTDDFPVGHTHQHAIFFAFVNTTYQGEKVDFWNQHQQTGTVGNTQLINYQSGPVYGQFEIQNEHLSLKHGPILKEHTKVTIFNTEPFQVRIHTTVQSIASDTLFINKYHYGGMAIRGAKVWNVKDSLHFQNEPEFTTNTDKDRATANHTRPLWSMLHGLIDGQLSGVAMLGHPTNYQHPEPVRIHPSMPYFCLSPMVDNGFFITPNSEFEATYTLVGFDGPPPSSFLNELVSFINKD